MIYDKEDSVMDVMECIGFFFGGMLSHSLPSRRVTNAKQRVAVYIRRTGKKILDAYAYIPYVKERVEKNDYHEKRAYREWPGSVQP